MNCTISNDSYQEAAKKITPHHLTASCAALAILNATLYHVTVYQTVSMCLLTRVHFFSKSSGWWYLTAARILQFSTIMWTNWPTTPTTRPPTPVPNTITLLWPAHEQINERLNKWMEIGKNWTFGWMNELVTRKVAKVDRPHYNIQETATMTTSTHVREIIEERSPTALPLPPLTMYPSHDSSFFLLGPPVGEDRSFSFKTRRNPVIS